MNDEFEFSTLFFYCSYVVPSKFIYGH